ncbi:hypothetical protein J6590_100746, partial [Homalodisca vitripennis]
MVTRPGISPSTGGDVCVKGCRDGGEGAVIAEITDAGGWRFSITEAERAIHCGPSL